MVMIGDKIMLDDGRIVRVLNIEQLKSGRYMLTYVSKFLEGDIDFEVVKD